MFQDALALHRTGRGWRALRGPTSRCARVRSGACRRAHTPGRPPLRLGQGFPDKAETLIGRAATIAHHTRTEAHANLAAALQAMRRYAEVVTHYRRAFALRPCMLDAQFGLASCLQALDQHTGRLLPATKHYSPPRQAPRKLISAWPRSLRRLEAIRTKLVSSLSRCACRIPTLPKQSFQIGHATDCEKGSAGGGNSTFPRCARRRPGLSPSTLWLWEPLSCKPVATTRPLPAFQSALAVEPQNDDVHVGLAKIFDRKRRYVEAIDHCPRRLQRNLRISRQWPLWPLP